EAADSLGEIAPTARRNGTARFVEGGKLLTAPNSVGGMEAALHLVSLILGKRQAQAVASSLGVAWIGGEPGGVDVFGAQGAASLLLTRESFDRNSVPPRPSDEHLSAPHRERRRDAQLRIRDDVADDLPFGVQRREAGRLGFADERQPNRRASFRGTFVDH